MSSAICFNLDQSKILLFGEELKVTQYIYIQDLYNYFATSVVKKCWLIWRWMSLIVS